MNDAYHRTAARFARIATINECSSMLSWDAATMMPKGGGAARGDQLAVLAGIAHGELIAPALGDDLAAARADEPWAAANLDLMRHHYRRATALPVDLVEAQARANSACEKIWRQAKADFGLQGGRPRPDRGSLAHPRGGRRARGKTWPQPL